MTRARIATSEATSNETKLVPSPSTHSVSEPEGLPEYRKSAITCSHRGESGTNPDQGKLGFLSTMSKVQPCHKKRTQEKVHGSISSARNWIPFTASNILLSQSACVREWTADHTAQTTPLILHRSRSRARAALDTEDVWMHECVGLVHRKSHPSDRQSTAQYSSVSFFLNVEALSIRCTVTFVTIILALVIIHFSTSYVVCSQQDLLSNHISC